MPLVESSLPSWAPEGAEYIPYHRCWCAGWQKCGNIGMHSGLWLPNWLGIWCMDCAREIVELQKTEAQS